MKSLLCPRVWIALSLAIAAAFVTYHWPSSPRATIACEDGCWHFAFSRDSTKLALLDRASHWNPAGHIVVVDVATGKVLQRVDIGPSACPNKVAFAPDGGSVGVVGAAGVVTKWDPHTDRLIARYDHAEWSHDPDHYAGREILFSATGGWLQHDVHDGRVYDVATGQIVHDYRERLPDRSLGVHGGCVAALVQDEVKTFDVCKLMISADSRRLATISADRTTLIWDLAHLFPDDGALPAAPSDLWTDLESADARRGRRAIERLIASPPHATQILRARLKPVATPDAKQLARWIADLDSDVFDIRQHAEQAMENLALFAEPALRKALSGTPSLETRRRIERLLRALDPRQISPEQIRIVRAVQVLEGIGNADAHGLLAELAAGPPGARPTTEAAAALARLAQRR